MRWERNESYMRERERDKHRQRWDIDALMLSY